jgi:hypothetical protein
MPVLGSVAGTRACGCPHGPCLPPAESGRDAAVDRDPRPRPRQGHSTYSQRMRLTGHCGQWCETNWNLPAESFFMNMKSPPVTPAVRWAVADLGTRTAGS